jgi:hypothetical protein
VQNKLWTTTIKSSSSPPSDDSAPFIAANRLIRFTLIVFSAAHCIACSPVFAQASARAVDEREVAFQAMKENVQDLVDLGTPLRGLKSITLAVSYLKDYKKENKGSIEKELLQILTVKLRTAGFKVQTEPELTKRMNDQMNAIKNGIPVVNSPEPADCPTLELRISAFKWVDNTTVATIDTTLGEIGYLMRSPKAKHLVISWSENTIDTDVVENINLHKHLLKVSNEQISDFIRNWLAQNKPQTITPKMP